MQTPADTRWIPHEDNLLRTAIRRYGVRRWDCIAAAVASHSEESCSTRWDELQDRWTQLNRQPWTETEDGLLRSVVDVQGATQWSMVSSFLPGRTAKQCRERWRYRLDPSIKRGAWSVGEDALLVTLQRKFGNSWSRIAADLPGRTDNSVKNRWHSVRFRHRKHEAKSNDADRQFQVTSTLSPETSSEVASGALANVRVPEPATLEFGSFASGVVDDSAVWEDLAACLLDDVPAETHDQQGE